jgi:hypothetical protein
MPQSNVKLDSAGTGELRVMISKKHLSHADLLHIYVLAQEAANREVEACPTCEGLDDDCERCQAQADLLKKLADCESLVAAGAVGILVIEPAKGGDRG